MSYGRPWGGSGYGPGGYGGYGGNLGRNAEFCPSGQGYPVACPMGGNDYTYTHCCTTFFIGGGGSCCYFALSIWNILAIVLALIVLLAVSLFLVCRFCSGCPLHTKAMEANRSRSVQHHYPPSQYSYEQQQPPRPGGIVHYEKEPFRHY